MQVLCSSCVAEKLIKFCSCSYDAAVLNCKSTLDSEPPGVTTAAVQKVVLTFCMFSWAYCPPTITGRWSAETSCEYINDMSSPVDLIQQTCSSFTNPAVSGGRSIEWNTSSAQWKLSITSKSHHHCTNSALLLEVEFSVINVQLESLALWFTTSGSGPPKGSADESEGSWNDKQDKRKKSKVL